MKDKVLVVIPAFNEEKNIERVVDNLIQNYPELDYVVVSDGSTDRTAEICEERGYCIVKLPVNLGLAGCFQTGMKYAWENDYECAIQFDGDGQHRPEFIAMMKKRLDEGYNIIIGSRFVEGKKDFSIRMIGSRLLSMAIRMTTGVKIADPTSGMRMFDRHMIHEFAYNINYGPEPDTISFLLKQGARVAEVPVKIDDRTAGESYLRPVVAMRYMLRMLASILIIQNFRIRKR
ncbi:glycosyltransferase family 2 protein [Clostridium sp. AM58-1XD]|uniref:glycosyltransferase family 2 protein n=1 Tax=Clostridium sp. AM58-1XD TaxID=2292307 RepID=UPI000E48CCF7|nr:glycosyltransferase family 2 protein [Clostridium sp. AM58-1XD]RGY98929.1 glycosyltransferase family 2 protein [Clostridium sp. AM58-1XD]